MKLRVLGCGGGIGGGTHTTSMLLDSDILIDGGTGVGSLTLDELTKIDHVFVTHAHLDHVAFIPFLVDTVGSLRDKPLTVYAIAPTLEILQQHLFNWHIWPDFTKIPSDQSPYMRYETISLGDVVEIAGRKIKPLPANHVVPAVGYQLDSGHASLVFTGDTTTNDVLWAEVNKIENLKYVVIESAFCEEKKEIAIRSGHLCPSLLATELEKLERHAEIFITHLKQGEEEMTMHQIEMRSQVWRPRALKKSQLFEF